MLTDHQIRKFVAERLMAQSAVTGDDIYTPTLVVGVGGTGIKVLRGLKKHLKRNESHQIRLLGIDTDRSENDKFQELPNLTDTELLLLDGDLAGRFLAQVAANPGGFPHILEYLPAEHAGFPNLHATVSAQIRRNIGAGQFRRTGRLAFHSNVIAGGNIMSRLRQVHADLTAIPMQQAQRAAGRDLDQGARVYVVGSFAGGTGAGLLLDLLATLRSVFTQPLDTITLFGVLPGALLDKALKDPKREKAQTRANALGVLADLQAALLGELNDLPFHLGEGAPFRPGIRGLLDTCYLVDERLYNGSSPRDFMDLCSGVALFLYALVGSGMGSDQDSGKINVAFSRNDGGGTGPVCCFNALGVASVAYPIDDLEEYAVRFIFDLWVDRWRSAESEAEATETVLSEIRSKICLNSADDFAAQVRIEIPDCEYFPSTGDRKQLLQLSDQEFVGERHRRYGELENALRRASRQIEARSVVFVEQHATYLSELMARLIGRGQNHTLAVLDALAADVERLQGEWVNSKAARTERIAVIERMLPRKESWIHFNDWYDGPPRRKYVALIQELFRLKYEAAFDAEVDEVIRELATRTSEWRLWSANLASGLEQDRQHNRQQIQTFDEARSGLDGEDFGVVHSAMPRSQFREWAESIPLKWPTELVPTRPDKSELIECVWLTMIEPFRNALRQFDLLAAARLEKDAADRTADTPTPTLNRLRALDTTAIPAIQLVDAAPLSHEMAPEKFVAGREIRQSNKWVIGLFEPVAGGGQPTGLEIAPPHFVISAQVYKGFGAVHWRGFSEAEVYYLQDPWRAGVLPDTVKISPLVALSSAEAVIYKALGLGLLCDAILLHGNAYHRNITSDGAGSSFSTYQIAPRKAAQKLISEGLVGQAENDLLDPPRESRLGAALSETLSSLHHVNGREFVGNIEIIFDRAKNRLGSKWVKDVIRDFLADDPERRFPTPDEVWRKIREALASYVARL